ncbi:MAG: hypothetical protein HKM93_06925 [Desulfobacteraceae bacterium]|nr:hypothetical protein [Desulfobacteraceae bacterium]
MISFCFAQKPLDNCTHRSALAPLGCRLKLIGALLCLILVLIGCSDESITSVTGAPGAVNIGFTFFELGEKSVYSRRTRDTLTDKLGPMSEARNTIIDLSVPDNAVLSDHFPTLDDINQRLNWRPRERIEHDNVKLMFRYARRKNIPLDLVEMYFSNQSRHPLYFHVIAKKDGGPFLETLKEKYGKPSVFEWGRDQSRTLYWQRGKDYFLVSIFTNRHNELEYHFSIYFVANLERMIEAEEAARRQRQAEKENAGKRAF